MPTPKTGELRSLLAFGDQRGIASNVLGQRDPLEIASVALRIARSAPTKVLITTGFFVKGRPETDGPIGAILLGAAFTSLGWKVGFVSAPDCLSLLKKCADFPAAYVEFPVQPEAASRTLAQRVLAAEQPDWLISIEVCGRTADSRYLNMKGSDISATTPRLDCLYLESGEQKIVTVGVGDGGNEVGFGSLAPADLAKFGVNPCAVATDYLLVGSVSNWAVYVLLALLSKQTGRNFVPDSSTEFTILKRLVANGAVDGFSGDPELKVDGRSPSSSQEFFRLLREFYESL
ncbi:MAG: DUF4392 domain-containing protein [Verrucomicrobia bacterium]|nr:DUF4392 domain-containing protein [Verrucomicrobiota bacterium]